MVEKDAHDETNDAKKKVIELVQKKNRKAAGYSLHQPTKSNKYDENTEVSEQYIPLTFRV